MKLKVDFWPWISQLGNNVFKNSNKIPINFKPTYTWSPQSASKNKNKRKFEYLPHNSKTKAPQQLINEPHGEILSVKTSHEVVSLEQLKNLVLL